MTPIKALNPVTPAQSSSLMVWTDPLTLGAGGGAGLANEDTDPASQIWAIGREAWINVGVGTHSIVLDSRDWRGRLIFIIGKRKEVATLSPWDPQGNVWTTSFGGNYEVVGKDVTGLQIIHTIFGDGWGSANIAIDGDNGGRLMYNADCGGGYSEFHHWLRIAATRRRLGPSVFAA